MKVAVLKLLYILLKVTRKSQKAQKCFALQNGCHTDHTDEHRLLFREAMIGRGVVLQKLRSVKTKNNLE